MNLVARSDPHLGRSSASIRRKQAFGELRDSSYLLPSHCAALNERLQEDGYLFLRGFLKREDVMAARRVIVERIAAEGVLNRRIRPDGRDHRARTGSFFRAD